VTRRGRVGATLAFALVCAAVALGLAWGYARVLAPVRRAGAVAPKTAFDRAPMHAAMSPVAVAETQTRILSAGSRYLGQNAVSSVGAEIRRAFMDAGLEVVEQQIKTLVPFTSQREIRLDFNGKIGPPLEAVEVYPLMPNHLQPVVTPAVGMTGRLLVLTPELLATAHDLHDVIGILDAGPGGVDPAYGFHWARYARLGVKAVILAHRGGLAEIDWNRVAQKKSGLVSSTPVNFVRLAATEGIFAYAGQRVRLDVRVDFREARSRTLIGVLRAGAAADEALVIAAPHDAVSVLPDLAPGALPAVQTAWMLGVLRGLAGSRATLTRDVVFVSSGSSVMGEDGLNQLLRVLQFNTFGSRTTRLTDAFSSTENDASTARNRGKSIALETRLLPLRQSEEEQRDKDALVRRVRRLLDNPQFFATEDATIAGLAGLSPAERRFFDEQLAHVVNTVALELEEPALTAKLDLERSGSEDPESPVARAYRAARREVERVSALAGSSPETMLARAGALVRDIELRERLRSRLDELHAFHAERLRELESDRSVARVFSRYRTFNLLKSSFVPSTRFATSEVLSLYAHSTEGTQSLELMLLDAARRPDVAGPGFRVERMAANQVDVVESNCQPWPLAHYFMLYGAGYQGVGLVNFERQDAYQEWASPVVRPFMRDLSSLGRSFAVSGELVLRAAHGEGTLSSPPGWPWQRRSYGGRVLAAGVGQALVPSYALGGAVVGARGVDGEEQHSELGYWRQPFYATDPYGHFELPEQTADFAAWWRVYSRGYAYTPVAVGYGSDGRIAYMKDEGEATQGRFKSVDVPMGNEAAVRDTTIVTFRAAPVTLLDLTNPQDFKDYSGVSFITRDGLAPFESSAEYVGLGYFTSYLPPDRYTKLLLQSGVEGNDRARETRAFMLGPAPPSSSTRDETAGRGYLVADHPFLFDVPLETARSMARVNGGRLALQNRHGMADERTNRYHQTTLRLLERASDRTASSVSVTELARDAVSYAGLDHPVLRGSVRSAVVGILFYLGLLVPFMFFVEKLVFASTDARRQLAGQGLVFLVTFGLLRVLHPAFELVRSPLMILLGFVIVLITAGITLLFSGKARESARALGASDGKPSGADVNALGVFASSLMIGLNNMHRRRLRTGLTCATITLLTFVMICFTSTQTDVADRSLTLGPAAYQGLLLKHDDFVPLSKSEVFALESKFGGRFPVVERRFFTGVQDWNERKRRNPNLNLSYEGGRERRDLTLGSILELDPVEPLRAGIRLVTQRGWFLPEHARNDGKPCPVLLPDRAAERLGIDPALVDREEVTVSVNGRAMRVWGIFDSSSLDALRDLDGRDLLPFDIERVATASETTVGNATVTTAKSDDPRLPAERLLITPVRDLGIFVANGRELTSSVAVGLESLAYRAARQEIDAHLEKTAKPAYFGLDGVAYRGQKTRELTLVGLVELIMPLLLAALTVLNTMRGSVYERRGEIYVYNAIGVAPRYVFAMFLAEALVYVVVGAMFGYLLSQGVGRALTALRLTGGLPMTFTSLSTVYATLAIGAAVVISTWFPARDAMRIAAPADESGWKLPEPVGDELSFDLPFTFRPRARLAVLAFFERWFSAHGEGSAEAFHAGVPELCLRDDPATSSDSLLPELGVTLWLKPFDLAVSERCVIALPFDADLGEFKARLTLTRSSGTREAWLRLNAAFVADLRRHFLHWRAVGEAEEAALFAEARAKLEARYPELVALGAPA
jgi:hypothetical protein